MKKISINQKGKRNIKLMLCFIALGATVGSFATYSIMNKVEKVEKTEEPKNGIIFKNEKVVIKYFDSERFVNGYDILVETRNDTNISSEWDMINGENNSIAYLVGNDKATARMLYENSLKYVEREPFQWEENYKIEGLDIPYN